MYPFEVNEEVLIGSAAGLTELIFFVNFTALSNAPKHSLSSLFSFRLLSFPPTTAVFK